MLFGAVAIVISLVSAKRTEGLVAAAVQVVNTPLPVETEANTHSPFATEIFPDPSVNPVAASFTVPAGKDLVIEDVGAVCTLAAAPRLMNLFATLPQPPRNIGYDHYFAPQPTAVSSGRGIYMVSRATRIYAAGGTQVSFEMLLTAPGTSDNCSFSVSGYLTKQFS